jgi:hypothetical protein
MQRISIEQREATAELMLPRPTSPHLGVIIVVEPTLDRHAVVHLISPEWNECG